MNNTRSTWYTLPFTWYDQESRIKFEFINYIKLFKIINYKDYCHANGSPANPVVCKPKYSLP